MTVVVYRDGILASDSQATHGDAKIATTTKLFTVDDKIIGFSGGLPHMHAYLMWCQDKGKEQPALPELDALAVDRQGAVWWFWEGHLYESGKADFHAIGSGRDFALGAMAQGATAEQAVEVVVQFDIYSCAPVQTLRLETLS